MNKYTKVFCEIALSNDVVIKAVKVALVVGSILNIINQGEKILVLDLFSIDYYKFLLTYFVPYSVTTYTAVTMKLSFHLGTKAVIETDLGCKKCKNVVHVQKNEIIPECSNCGVTTHWTLK